MHICEGAFVSATDRLRALYPHIPSHEWDRGACGIGLIANMDGRPTRCLVTEALDALGCLSHRGASSRVDAADPGTSDGAGLMVDLPVPFLADRFEILSPRSGDLAARDHPCGLAMLFLPPRQECAARGLVQRALCALGLEVLGWRDVPVELDVLGTRAREAMPCITQVLVARPPDVDVAPFELLLYRARRRIERRAARDGLDLTVVSLSAHTVVYKGLVMATALGDFYAADLGQRDFQASVAMYHQRYATNTLPDWSLAQPFHRICHNGEINTLLGNRGWVAARERALAPTMRRRLAPLLGDGSDSVQLDRLTGRCYHDKEVKAELIALTADWEQMLERHVVVGGIAPPAHPEPDAERFLRLQLAAGVTQDDLTYFMLPMVRKGKEAVFSMGDDTQLTPFVARPRLFADHLRQRFAQVTNPPIDPYREGAVFDTTVYLGRLEGFFGGPLAGRSIALESPILSAETFAWVLAQSDVCRLCTVFPVADGADGAARALDELERAAVEAAQAGAQVIVLSDRAPR